MHHVDQWLCMLLLKKIIPKIDRAFLSIEALRLFNNAITVVATWWSADVTPTSAFSNNLLARVSLSCQASG